MLSKLNIFFEKKTEIAPIVIFRILFGLVLFYSTIRFINKGWVETLYVQPNFYFTYFGFDWVKPLSETGMSALFFTLILTSLMVVLGLFYRYSIIIFFLVFTYIELIDKTNYLNHYYFVSLITFLLMFIPANRAFSLDVYFKIVQPYTHVKTWMIWILKFQIGLVYFFAGIAKLNYHWLIEAQPLSNWLKHQTELPIIGQFMSYKATAYVFSWFGAIYDLSIPFLLLIKSTRLFAYMLVITFHILTAIMFPIGVFPYVMIISTLIFFPTLFHQQILSRLRSFSIFKKDNSTHIQLPKTNLKMTTILVGLYLVIQLCLPLRHFCYPKTLFWTEQGYRFSWRVMLIEKAGYAEFKVEDPNHGFIYIDNSKYLTPQQEKMMSTQPDMILQYAHFIRDIYTDTTITENNTTFYIKEPIVKANVYVSLFNKGSQLFINPETNLAKEKRGWHHKNWITTYE